MTKFIRILFVISVNSLLASCGWPDAKNRYEVTDRHIDGAQIANSVGKEDEDLSLATQYCNSLARQFGNFFGPPINGRRGFVCGNWVTGEPVVRSVSNPSNSPRTTSSVDTLTELASSDCRTRGLSRGTARWSRCEQEARTFYAASGSLHDPAATRRILSDHAVADSRCFSAGLRRGTTEFETCTIQARTNLRSEAYASDQAAMRTRLETDRQQAIEMARLEAEKARREERNFRMMQLGLGMAAGAYSAPPPPQTRTYIINGRPFHCSTTGGITNCF